MEEGPRQKELPGAVVPGGDGLGPLEELQAGPGGLCSVRSVGEGGPRLWAQRGAWILFPQQ